MLSPEYPVYPNAKKTLTICKFTYSIVELKLFESIRIAVYLYNENNIIVDSKQFFINGDEYIAWNNDDKYIINLLKEKIQKDYNPNI